MHLNSDKFKKLVGEYPFIRDILEIPFHPRGGVEGGNQIDDVTVTVERADGDLMFRQANNIGIGDHGFMFETSGRRKDLVGRRLECVIAVDADGSILDILYWPNNDEEARGKPELYAKMIFWATRSEDGWASDPIWDVVERLVWVRISSWHEDTRQDGGPGSRFGTLRSRTASLTIYGKPDVGFENLDRGSSFERNLRLTSRRLIAGTVRKDVEIIRLSGMLDEMCRQFAEDVFFSGMKEVLDAGEVRGASGQFGPAKVLCAEMCGYDRVMLEDTVSYITFQRRPDSDGMYVLGMDGTVPQLRALVRGVIRGWGNPEARSGFKPDGNVSVL